jgi:phytoene dehydrogenase-like protein
VIGNHYDVIVLGTHIGPLCAGALLARRGFRVLVLGQYEPPPTYTLPDGNVVPRNPLTFTVAASPVARAVFAELALGPVFRRRATVPEPAFQVALPHHRLDLSPDEESLDREVAREMPEARQAIADFHRFVRRATAALDRVLERDLTWPPESFFERRAFARATTDLPFDRQGAGRDPLAELGDTHPFRWVVHAPVRFIDGMDPDYPTPLRLVRLYGSALAGSAAIDGGERALADMVIGKLQSSGGTVRERDRADAIVVQRGAAVGVRLAGSGEVLGASHVVYGGDVARLGRLLDDHRPLEEVYERLGEPQPRWYRYAMNVLLERGGLPEPMARDVYFVRDPRRPLAAENLLHVQRGPESDGGRQWISVEVLLPRRAVEDLPAYLDGLRERVFASLGELIPFLGRSVVLVDSPHDGRPVQDVRGGRTLAPREPWARGPRTMRIVYGYPVPGPLGVCGMPSRLSLRHLLLCGTQTVPGLGLEGALVAAASTARLVTAADRRGAWLRGRWRSLREG